MIKPKSYSISDSVRLQKSLTGIFSLSGKAVSKKVSSANQAGKDVLEANRKLVEQLDVKMKDFVSYQKMTYETMEEVRRLFADISVQKEDNNIYLSGGKSAQSAAQKESVEEVRKLLEEQSERQEALLEEMNKNMKNISKNQKGKFSLFK